MRPANWNRAVHSIIDAAIASGIVTWTHDGTWSSWLHFMVGWIGATVFVEFLRSRKR